MASPLIATTHDSLIDSETGTASDGMTTAIVDLLGKAVESTDVWGTTTVPTYEPVSGRVLSVTTTPPVGATTTEFTYDLEGKVETITIDSDLVAEVDYDTVTQRIESVLYGNGTVLGDFVRNRAGAALGMTWEFDTSTVAEEGLLQVEVTPHLWRLNRPWPRGASSSHGKGSWREASNSHNRDRFPAACSPPNSPAVRADRRPSARGSGRRAQAEGRRAGR